MQVTFAKPLEINVLRQPLPSQGEKLIAEKNSGDDYSSVGEAEQLNLSKARDHLDIPFQTLLAGEA